MWTQTLCQAGLILYLRIKFHILKMVSSNRNMMMSGFSFEIELDSLKLMNLSSKEISYSNLDTKLHKLKQYSLWCSQCSKQHFQGLYIRNICIGTEKNLWFPILKSRFKKVIHIDFHLSQT